MGALKENRDKWGEELGQAYEHVKGTREERKIKDVVWSDNGYKYWEGNLGTRLKHVKKTGEIEAWEGGSIIEKGLWIVEEQKKDINEHRMMVVKIVQDFEEELEAGKKRKFELVEILEKLREEMEKDREDRRCKVKQVQGWVKGTEKEIEIEYVRQGMKEDSEYWEGAMNRRIEFVKEVRRCDVEYTIDDCISIVKKHKEELEEGSMIIEKILGDLDRKLREEKAKEKSEEENKQVEDIESRSKTEAEEELERKEKENKAKGELIEKFEELEVLGATRPSF